MNIINNANPLETAEMLSRSSECPIIIDFFLHKLCEDIELKRFDDKCYWLDVREEWERLKMYDV